MDLDHSVSAAQIYSGVRMPVPEPRHSWRLNKGVGERSINWKESSMLNDKSTEAQANGERLNVDKY